MGGWEKRGGVENLTNDTRFWTSPHTVRFPPPSGVSALFSCTKIPTEQTKALLEGSKKFRESAFSGTFSSPIRFAPPHITAQRGGWRKESLPHHRFRPFFCPLFLCPLMSRRTQFWGTFFAVFWVPFLGVLQGAAQRGGQFYLIFAVLRTLFSCSKMSLFYLKTCTPMKATP